MIGRDQNDERDKRGCDVKRVLDPAPDHAFVVIFEFGHGFGFAERLFEVVALRHVAPLSWTRYESGLELSPGSQNEGRDRDPAPPIRIGGL